MGIFAKLFLQNKNGSNNLYLIARTHSFLIKNHPLLAPSRHPKNTYNGNSALKNVTENLPCRTLVWVRLGDRERGKEKKKKEREIKEKKKNTKCLPLFERCAFVIVEKRRRKEKTVRRMYVVCLYVKVNPLSLNWHPRFVVCKLSRAWCLNTIRCECVWVRARVCMCCMTRACTIGALRCVCAYVRGVCVSVDKAAILLLQI